MLKRIPEVDEHGRIPSGRHSKVKKNFLLPENHLIIANPIIGLALHSTARHALIGHL